MAKLYGALAVVLTAMPTAAIAQEEVPVSLFDVDCNSPGVYCASSTTTVTSGSDGESRTFEKRITIGGKPVEDDVEDDSAPKARRVIQPKRDDSAMPGMHFDPALGYYVPN